MTATQVRPMFTMQNCNISVEAQEEYAPIKGNAIASDDEAYDRKVERSIKRDLNNGNEWAWCTIKVTVSPKDPDYCDIEASAYLGCCSYKSKKDFVKNSGYYECMVSEALDDLNRNI